MAEHLVRVRVSVRVSVRVRVRVGVRVRVKVAEHLPVLAGTAAGRRRVGGYAWVRVRVRGRVNQGV